ncbi:hypothetical protein [Mycoplasma sp. Ms02]|uniref:hypothetical protein n=1 Tax=Mycoplasma sp. Ms02 TaxID=353851 RepID=UPI001C89447C|nr:hypothetical protein [Mycoplasma sp. Ms02]QZE12609.1 hypothetical protein K4L35_01325 [Mycoplasma sp. Ms02]
MKKWKLLLTTAAPLLPVAVMMASAETDSLEDIEPEDKLETEGARLDAIKSNLEIKVKEGAEALQEPAIHWSSPDEIATDLILVYQGQEKALEEGQDEWVFEDQDFKVKRDELSIEDQNDIEGYLKIRIDMVYSNTDEEYTSLSEEPKVIKITGFKTEEDRLNQLIKEGSLGPKGQARDPEAMKEVNVDDVTNQNFLEHVILGVGDNASALFADLSFVEIKERNQDEGTITIKAKIKSNKTYGELVRDDSWTIPEGAGKDAVSNVSSTDTVDVIVTGFKKPTTAVEEPPVTNEDETNSANTNGENAVEAVNSDTNETPEKVSENTQESPEPTEENESEPKNEEMSDQPSEDMNSNEETEEQVNSASEKLKEATEKTRKVVLDLAKNSDLKEELMFMSSLIAASETVLNKETSISKVNDFLNHESTGEAVQIAESSELTDEQVNDLIRVHELLRAKIQEKLKPSTETSKNTAKEAPAANDNQGLSSDNQSADQPTTSNEDETNTGNSENNTPENSKDSSEDTSDITNKTEEEINNSGDTSNNNANEELSSSENDEDNANKESNSQGSSENANAEQPANTGESTPTKSEEIANQNANNENTSENANAEKPANTGQSTPAKSEVQEDSKPAVKEDTKAQENNNKQEIEKKGILERLSIWYWITGALATVFLTIFFIIFFWRRKKDDEDQPAQK